MSDRYVVRGTSEVWRNPHDGMRIYVLAVEEDKDESEWKSVAMFRFREHADRFAAELNREEETRCPCGGVGDDHPCGLAKPLRYAASLPPVGTTSLVAATQHKDACTGDAGKYQSGRAIEMQWLIRRICEEARRCDSVIDALCMAKRSADNACVRWPEDHRWLTDIAVEVIRDRETMATQHKDAHRMDAGENR